MASTNRPETLDPALMRPGQLDRQVFVDRLDKVGWATILRILPIIGREYGMSKRMGQVYFSSKQAQRLYG